MPTDSNDRDSFDPNELAAYKLALLRAAIARARKLARPAPVITLPGVRIYDKFHNVPALDDASDQWV